MIIAWSEDDHVYLVTLPEWQERGVVMPCTHGTSFARAARRGQEVLETLIEMEEEEEGSRHQAPLLERGTSQSQNT
jgi:predicted RNase H-like HicB family nuclease